MLYGCDYYRLLPCVVLERYSERLSDRRVEAIIGNVAVIPCMAVSQSVPAAHTQFEFNSARLRMTSKSRDLPFPHFRFSLCLPALSFLHYFQHVIVTWILKYVRHNFFVCWDIASRTHFIVQFFGHTVFQYTRASLKLPVHYSIQSKTWSATMIE